MSAAARSKDSPVNGTSVVLYEKDEDRTRVIERANATRYKEGKTWERKKG